MIFGGCHCARNVHESDMLRPFGLSLSEKQIPQVVGNVRNQSRKWKCWNELSCLQSRCPPTACSDFGLLVTEKVFSHVPAWVQVWVQLEKEKWLPIPRKRHQIGHLDFCHFRLLTEGFQISLTLVSSARLHAVEPTDRNRRAIDGLRWRLHNTSNKL